MNVLELLDGFSTGARVALLLWVASTALCLAYVGVRWFTRRWRFRQVRRDLERTHRAAYRERMATSPRYVPSGRSTWEESE